MREYQRSKAPLALMEQIVMILVFAVASAVCLQAFVYADHLSRQGDRIEKAWNKAQTVVEYCKDYHGELDAVCDLLGGKRHENGLSVCYEKEGMKLTLQLTEQTKYRQKAVVCVQEEKGEELCRFETAWQKEEAS